MTISTTAATRAKSICTEIERMVHSVTGLHLPEADLQLCIAELELDLQHDIDGEVMKATAEQHLRTMQALRV